MSEWKLKKGADVRMRSGHPWAFTSELAQSPTNLRPGDPVLLFSDKGHFLARGYGNPNSQICFRALSHNGHERDLPIETLVQERLLAAWRLRLRSNFTSSFRWVFSEADQLPGLIVDRYLLASEAGVQHQVISFQILTAGMAKILSTPLETFKTAVDALFANNETKTAWEQTFVVDRSDVNIRKLEGLPVPRAQVLKGDLEKLRSAKIQLSENFLECDLIEGQKTGLFLDQTQNIQLVIKACEQRQEFWRSQGKTKIRILDLCTYVGQWSLQIGSKLKKMGFEVECHLLDISESALARAEKNIKQAGLASSTYQLDVLKDVDRWPEGVFEIVISDPPAFVKNRKDLEVGEAAYTKLNAQAFRKAQQGSLVVSCTCSGAVDHETFSRALSNALRKSGQRGAWIAQGAQGLDHPRLPQFPEGHYLKMILTEIL